MDTSKYENQFDALRGKPEDNRDVLKEMATEFFRKLYGMVEDAGGDADYIQGWIDGVDNDLDCAFGDLIESRGPYSTVPVFKRRSGLDALVRGASI